jgi:uncharacterized pyridoxamine 5'-phosphate oxidase family protein
MITLTTKSGVWRIDDSVFIKQYKVINHNNNTTKYFCQLKGSNDFEIVVPVKNYPVEERIIEKAKFTLNVVPIETTETQSETLPSAQSIPSANTGKLTCSTKPKDQTGKVKGEMIWTHKTAPELQISDSNGTVIKQVDVAKMYKRR